MNSKETSNRGFAEILFALALLSVAGLATYASWRSSTSASIARLQILNGVAGFYAGEMVVISTTINNLNSSASLNDTAQTYITTYENSTN